MKTHCLACTFYRPEDLHRGRCRVDKESLDARNYPIMNHQDCCERWKGAGQQYYIRVGWLKKTKEVESEAVESKSTHERLVLR